MFLRVEFRVLEKILLGSQPLSLYLWYLILTYSFSLCPSHSGLMHDHCSELHEPLAEDPGFSWLRQFLAQVYYWLRHSIALCSYLMIISVSLIHWYCMLKNPRKSSRALIDVSTDVTYICAFITNDREKSVTDIRYNITDNMISHD